nr:cellulose binding domain-containing protein [Saccharothrix syringae]
MPSRGCSATYRTTAQWSGGFQAEVRVTAGSAAITGWTVGWTFAAGERVNSIWGATATTSGTSVSARNAAYNGSLAAGGSTTFGFVASGTAGTPTLTCTAS